MPVFQRLPQALRWLRLQSNRKQGEVARSAGISASMLSSFEQGHRKPALDSLEKLLDGLDADLFQLAEALRQVQEQDHPVQQEQGQDVPGQRRAGRPVAGSRRPEAAAAARPDGGSAGGEEPALDLGRLLGDEEPLAPEEESALQELVGGFLRWLRYLRAELQRPGS